MVTVNLLGVIHGTRAAATTMLASGGGRILNVASLAGWAPVPHLAAYSAAKHGVRAFSVAAAAELRNTSVSVACLLPDGIRTPMVDVHVPRLLMSSRVPPPRGRRGGPGRDGVLDSGRLLASVPPRRGRPVRSSGHAIAVVAVQGGGGAARLPAQPGPGRREEAGSVRVSARWYS